MSHITALLAAIRTHCQYKVYPCLDIEGQQLGPDVVERGIHGAELHVGKRGWSSGDEIVHHLPIPRDEFERIGDPRKKDESDREEGDEQDGCLSIGIPARECKA